jgi:glutathione peroxidase
MSIYEREVRAIEGQTQSLAAYRGQALLIVNVASQCGFTPQYAGLEELYRRHKHEGFAVLGFPCNQFGRQEPGSEAEIQTFCSLTYNVTFPLFAKIDVNGTEEHPLYRYLKSARRGLLGTRAIKWNFTKFLVDRHGNVVGRYGPLTKPANIERDVSRVLASPASV